MTLLKIRPDVKESQDDGAIIWYCEWVGGPTLSKVENCRLDGLAGEMRATVYIQSEPDTLFSIPAKCRLRGVVINGYVTNDNGQLVFRHGYY